MRLTKVTKAKLHDYMEGMAEKVYPKQDEEPTTFTQYRCGMAIGYFQARDIFKKASSTEEARAKLIEEKAKFEAAAIRNWVMDMRVNHKGSAAAMQDVIGFMETLEMVGGL